MLCTLRLSLSTNCKNAMLKLTQNTSRKVIATNGSEVCKIGHHYPVLTLWGWGSCSRWRLVGSLVFPSGWRIEERTSSLSLDSAGKFPAAECYRQGFTGQSQGQEMESWHHSLNSPKLILCLGNTIDVSLLKIFHVPICQINCHQSELGIADPEISWNNPGSRVIKAKWSP